MLNLKNCESVILDKNDTDSILELINLTQPNDPWTKEHFEWQYFEGPAGHAKIYGIKNHKGKVVSIYSAVPKIFKCKNHEIIGRHIQDVMTHPDYRGRGFLHYLASLAVDDIKKKKEIGYTFPNQKSEKSFIRNNWDQLCLIPLRVKKLTNKIKQEEIKMTNIKGKFDNSISSIWENSGIKIGVKRDVNFLNWRYDRPGVKYFKFILDSNEGFLILKIFNDKEKSFLHICDLVVKEHRMDLISQALKFSEQFGINKNCKTITSWNCVDHLYAKYYDEEKMTISSIQKYCFVLSNKFTIEYLKKPKLWYLSHGDSDVY